MTTHANEYISSSADAQCLIFYCVNWVAVQTEVRYLDVLSSQPLVLGQKATVAFVRFVLSWVVALATLLSAYMFMLSCTVSQFIRT